MKFKEPKEINLQNGKMCKANMTYNQLWPEVNNEACPAH